MKEEKTKTPRIQAEERKGDPAGNVGGIVSTGREKGSRGIRLVELEIVPHARGTRVGQSPSSRERTSSSFFPS